MLIFAVKMHRTLLLFIPIYLLSSCIQRPGESDVLSEGVPAEILVITDEDQLNDVETGFQRYFNVKDSNLIRADQANEKKLEKLYSFWFARSKSYDGTEKTAPLMLIYGESGKYSSDLTKRHPVESFNSKNGFALQVFKNVWAKPQTVIRLRYGRDMSPQKILQNGGDREIAEMFLKHETSQGLPGNLASNDYTDSVSKSIENNYGFGFSFPPQFHLAYINSDIVWLQQETQKFYRHIFINLFSDSVKIESAEKAIENRNYFTRKYIQNTEGTKTLVSGSDLFPVSWKITNGVGVLRGWYQEEGTFRRGPFVRYYFHDKPNRRYIAFDGFLYAPEMNKVSFYRLFDIIAHSYHLRK